MPYSIRIVLCSTVHPGNIGATARVLKTMGLVQLYLVNPARYPDPQAEWLASGATDVLRHAKRCASLDEALAGAAFSVACTARTRELAVPMVTAREAATQVIEVARRQTAALVFGNETFGLTAAEVNPCRLLATIPAIESGFLNPAHPKKLMPRLRRLFSRAQLEKEEVNILRGVLKTLRLPKPARSQREKSGKALKQF